MIPILFDSDEENFTSNGIGRLSDAISCVVLEERNGRYELEMEYPSEGILYQEILTGRYIYCSVGREKRQPFEIYASSKPINGKVTFYARHISYRLSMIPVRPFTSPGLPAVWNGIVANAMDDLPFSFVSYFYDFSKSFKQELPGSVRSFLGGGEGSILDLYGGEFEWDMWTVRLWNNRGSDKGVIIRYGKNMTDLKQEESIEDMYTGVVPYYNAKDTVVYGDVQLSELAENYPYDRVIVVDVSDKFDDIPTKAEVEAAGVAYITEHNFGIPSVNLKVSFINLADTEEYKNVAALETVSLCDTVTVYFERLGVSAKSKVITTKWDSLKERYNSIELGEPKASMSTRVAQKEAKKDPPPTYDDLQEAIDHATELITGEAGGYVVLHQNNEGKPYEILVMDNEDINLAVNVWRFNQAGWGHSSDGYGGPYTLAATIDNGIVADFITTGTLNANLIKAGIIQDRNNKNSMNMVTGAFSLCNGNLEYDLSDGEFIKLKNNLSLKLNGIPLAGILYKNIGSAYDSSKAVSSYNTVILRPYDCTFNGVIENITSYTYNEDGRKLIKDVPVPDGEIGRTYGQISICVPGYTVSSGGGYAYKADPEIIWIWRSWERFTTQAQYEAWAQDYQFCKRVTKDGYIYGVYAYIELRSSAAAEEFLEINVTYPTWQHTEE